MGEHKHNQRAIEAASRPRQPQPNQCGVDVRIGFAPKPNVLILPPDKIREVEGRVEVFATPAPHTTPFWHEPPSGTVVVAQGSQMGMESMDVVVNLCAVAQTNMVGAHGEPVGRLRVLRELFREDASAFTSSMDGRPKPVTS